MNIAGMMISLESSSWSVALRESLHAYTWTEVLHVLAIMFFVGTIAIFDLRLMGRLFTDIPISRVSSWLLPWVLVGFAAIALSGSLLFFAVPVRNFHSVWFRLKILLIVAGAVNAWIFHHKIRKHVPAWNNEARPPFPVRLAGSLSLATWIGVILVSRMIAYNWFDCGKAQAAWISWFAGCQ